MTSTNLDDDVLRTTINGFLDSRSWPKTICPSEPARALPADQLAQLENGWRDVMEDIRRILFELRDAGKVEILQKGQVLSGEIGLEDVKGPIRARRVQLDESQDAA